MNQAQIYPYEWSSVVEAHIGSFIVLSDQRQGSSRTGVWKIQASQDQACYYLKTFSRKQRWHPEVYAYNHWVNGLQPYVPELIAAFEGEGWQAILISAIEGITMREVSLEPDKRYAVYQKAGQLTKWMHEAKKGEWFGRPDREGNPIELYHHTDPVIYIRDTLLDFHGKCMEAQLLQPSEIELLQWALQHVDVFEGSKPVPISWDSTPGNWLVDADGEFAGMIDFENMLWGVDVDNFSVLFEKYFINDEPAMKAFFDGYGTDILEHKAIHIRICCVKLALGDIYWGTQNNLPGVIAHGRRLLASLQITDNPAGTIFQIRSVMKPFLRYSLRRDSCPEADDAPTIAENPAGGT